MYRDKTQILTNFPSSKTSGTRDSFTFSLRFLYELKHKARLSKTAFLIFHFRFRFVFIKLHVFVQQNA